MDLSKIYLEHYLSLVLFLYRRFGDHARAEDLAQEAFIHALEHKPAKPRAWLFTVAANLARDEGRRASVRRRHLTLVKAEAEARPPAPPPDVAYERREAVKKVQAALAQLKDRDRDALLLWEEGFSYEEIADTVGLSRGSIGTTMARARARLAAAYQQLEEQRGSEDVAH